MSNSNSKPWAGDITYGSAKVSGLSSSGAAPGGVLNGILTNSGLKGNPGNDGATPADGNDSSMHNITVGGHTYASHTLTRSNIPWYNSYCRNTGCLHWKRCRVGRKKRVEVDGQVYHSGTLTWVVFQGVTASLSSEILTLDNLPGPPGKAVNGTDGKNSAVQDITVGVKHTQQTSSIR